MPVPVTLLLMTLWFALGAALFFRPNWLAALRGERREFSENKRVRGLLRYQTQVRFGGAVLMAMALFVAVAVLQPGP